MAEEDVVPWVEMLWLRICGAMGRNVMAEGDVVP